MSAARLARTLLPLAALLTAVFLAACGDSGEEVPDGAAGDPVAMVERMLAALEAGEYAATAPLVVEEQLVVITSLEGGTAAQTARSLEGGVSDAIRESFWSAFVEGLGGFGGLAVTDLVPGSPSEFEVDGVDFASVPIGLGTDDGQITWITRNDGSGWRLDLFATFAPAFAQPTSTWLDGLVEGEDLETVRDALADQAPSLRAWLIRTPVDQAAPGSMAEVDRFLARLE